MTWAQVAVICFLIFAVGWVVEARLERVIKELNTLRWELDKHFDQIDRHLPD